MQDIITSTAFLFGSANVLGFFLDTVFGQNIMKCTKKIHYLQLSHSSAKDGNCELGHQDCCQFFAPQPHVFEKSVSRKCSRALSAKTGRLLNTLLLNAQCTDPAFSC